MRPASGRNGSLGEATPRQDKHLQPGFIIAVGVLLFLILTLPRALLVWRTGQFFDTDDALRMVEMREWLAGGGWFDGIVERMGLPLGMSLHWSRLIDAPLAAMTWLFSLFASPDMAVRLTRIAVPFLLSAVFFTAVAWLTRIANRGAGTLATILLALCATGTMSQFDPGRVDHHGPQIILLILATGLTMRALAFESGRKGAALLAGVLSSVSIAISVENLPFLAILAAAYGLCWAWRGRDMAPVLRAYAAGLALSSAGLFFLLVPPSSYGVGACDAFSSFHLTAALAGGCIYGILPLLDVRDAPGGLRILRLSALAGGGLLLAVALAALFPGCFGDPLAGVDPLARELWLANVAEARPLRQLLTRRPDLALPLAIPIGLGLLCALAASLAALRRPRPDAPSEAALWLLNAALLAVGLAATFWQVRAAASTIPLATPPAVWLARAIVESRGWSERPLLRLAPVALLAPFATLFWQMVIPAPARAPSREGQLACFAPRAFAPLANLRPGLVLSSVDSGSFILAHTRHNVLAGPYHRNNQGNAAAIRTFLADAGAAHLRVDSMGVDYIAICPGQVDVQIYAGRAPDGLAAQLLRGETPSWLIPVPSGRSPLRVYRVRTSLSARE